MPDPDRDADQLRFTQIRGRMLDGLVENLPELMVEGSGAADRSEFHEKLCQSSMVLSIIDVCAYVSQTIEEERCGRR